MREESLNTILRVGVKKYFCAEIFRQFKAKEGFRWSSCVHKITFSRRLKQFLEPLKYEPDAASSRLLKSKGRACRNLLLVRQELSGIRQLFQLVGQKVQRHTYGHTQFVTLIHHLFHSGKPGWRYRNMDLVDDLLLDE